MWPARFAEETERLRIVCGPGVLRIDHVGSTSVPGLEETSVIDVQMTVNTLAPLIDWTDRLARLGYTQIVASGPLTHPSC